jgi:hypothetical protein
VKLAEIAMPTIKTVRIEHEDVPTGIVINEEDFDARKHIVFGAKREKLTLATKDAPPA